MFTNKKDIEAWLDKYQIKNYTLHHDLSVDVHGIVDLARENLTSIPVQFNRVDGVFDCSDNQLTSLRGCPRIVGHDFWCSKNELTSLEFSPSRVGGNFDCSRNQLTSLFGAPDRVERSFACYHNQISSLEFCPGFVGKQFYSANNPGIKQFRTMHIFSLIKAEHLRIQAILQEKDKLDELLNHQTKWVKQSVKI